GPRAISGRPLRPGRRQSVAPRNDQGPARRPGDDRACPAGPLRRRSARRATARPRHRADRRSRRPRPELAGLIEHVACTHSKWRCDMPREAWSDKRERQYEHVKESELERGRGEDAAERIAAATV